MYLMAWSPELWLTRDAYDPQGRPIRIGKHGFYLRPAFVAAILRQGT